MLSKLKDVVDIVYVVKDYFFSVCFFVGDVPWGAD